MKTGDSRADVIGKIMLLQSMVVTLPSEKIRDFVCQGLKEMPGVMNVWHEQVPGKQRSVRQDDELCFAVECRNHSFGTIVVKASDVPAFDPYIAYVHNLARVIGLTLAERSQRSTIERQQRALERQLQERTRALKESEALYQSLFNSIRDAILITSKERQIVGINPAGAELFGFSVDELVNKPTLVLYEDEQEHKKMGQALREQAFDSGFVTMLNYRRKDGKTFTGETSAFRLYDHAENHIGFIGIIRDVTQRLEVEAELAQVHKMESVGRLAGGIAHDFNNMLTVILGHNEIAMNEVGDDHPVKEDLEEIGKAATQSAQLVSQLLAYARKQPISPHVINLNDAIENMLRMLRRLIGEDVDLKWLPGPDLWRVSMDPVQVDQMLANLVVNARDAVEGVGDITIETRNITVGTEQTLANDELEPGDYLLLTVRDSGQGMDAEILDKIFEPFFTTKEHDRGTGLGLSIVHGIVEQNHGHITVSSAVGLGTTFNIYLPKISEGQLPNSIARPESSVAGGPETILVVEDEEPLLALIVRMLKDLGYQILSAKSGREALDLVGQHENSIDLMLTDIVMPEMSGHELAREVSMLRPGTRVMFMSGYSANSIVDRVRSDRDVELLQKPFSARKLGAHIRRVLDAG